MKIFILIFFFFIFTMLVWSLGLVPKESETAMKYLVFSAQLLYGNMCYDLMKTMRAIPSHNEFWDSTFQTSIEALLWLVVAIVSLVVAIKIFLLAYVGLVVAVICYVMIFVRVLPKLQLLYAAAIAGT
jgi:hypothetical protein